MANGNRLYRCVMDKLERMIDDGEYPAGGRLPPERELAERLGVSRPTIREAIIALEALDRVEVKTGSGVYVLDTSSRRNGIDMSVTALELTEARALIEGEAAALAATMISDEQLDELEQALQDMADESADDELASEFADQHFHHLLAKATQNEMLAAVIDNLWFVRDHSPSIRAVHQAICESDSELRIREHQQVFEALKRRDPQAARKAMHEHFARLLDKMIVARESEQIELARRKASESRQRFSLEHLVSEA